MRYSLVAFDLYGTLLDVSGLAERLERHAGPEAATLLRAWRKEQLERSWREKEYQPFDVVTVRALETVAPHLDAKRRAAMCETWLSLPPYPDARATLESLRKAGARRAILSNGTRAMIEAALAAAGLAVDEVRSVDEVRCYKPDPRVYALLPPEGTLFVSANGWDAGGAKRNGLTVAFIDRGSPGPDPAPDLHLRSLSEVAASVAGRPATGKER
jgi:2-haloacid dehalogenase